MVSPNADPWAGSGQSEVSAVVKWYNPNKGFGFVQPDDGSPDAFLHASVVAQAGYQELMEGTKLVCEIAMGPRGPQVAAIYSLEQPSEPLARSSRPRPQGHGGHFQGGPTEVVEGKVKFFNAEKGFGFIVPDDGSKDVFISARILTRAGIAALEAEQRVRVTTRMGQKGPMAAHVELL